MLVEAIVTAVRPDEGEEGDDNFEPGGTELWRMEFDTWQDFQLFVSEGIYGSEAIHVEKLGAVK